MDFADCKPCRTGDIELMQLFVKHGVKQLILQTLNNCQMYLQVFLLSDIVMGAGDQIQPQFWEQYQPMESQMEWPQMITPTKHHWIICKQVLTEMLHLGQNQHLAKPLGTWNYQLNMRGWYYHHGMNSLWEATALQWMRYGAMPHRTRQQMFHTQGQIDQPLQATELEKVTATMRGDKRILTGSYRCATPEQGIDLCPQTPTRVWAQQWELDVELTGSQQIMRSTLLQGKGIVVCDGSFKDEARVAAWLIEGTTAAN